MVEKPQDGKPQAAQAQIAHLVALSLILLLAAGLRLWKLDTLPPGLYHDEAYNGLDALSLLEGKTFPRFYEGWELYAQDAHAGREPVPTRFPVFFEGNYGREPLHIYLMALSIKVLGPTPFAIRLVPAAAGILAVLATYLAASALLEIGDWRGQSPIPDFAPLFAAFTMAVLFPAVHFSRFGIRAMLFVPVATLAVTCFWRGVNGAGEQGSGGAGEIVFSGWRLCFAAPLQVTIWFALAGFLVGLGLYTYAAARLLPLVFVLFVLYWFWTDRAALRRHWLNVSVMALVSLLTALPLLVFFVRTPYFFVFRIAYVANKGRGTVVDKPWLTWLNNSGRVVWGLFWSGETHLRHNLPERPYLDPIQAGLFLLGLISQARRWFQPRSVFLSLWLLVMLLPSILSGDAPHFGRLIGAAPVVAIFAGVGADWIWQKISRQRMVSRDRNTRHWQLVRQPKVGQPKVGQPLVAYCLLFIALGATLFLTVRDYFGRYARHPDLARDFYLTDWEVGQYAAGQTADTILYLTPTQAEMATIYFALADPERLRSYNGSDGLIPAGQPGVPGLYLVRPTDAVSLDRLLTFFPQGRVGPARPSFVPFYVPGEAPRVPAENRTNHNWDGQIKLVGWSLARQEGQLHVTLFWQAVSQMARDYTAFVHVLDGTGKLVAQMDRPPAGYPTRDWRPGEVIMDTYQVDLPTDLPSGEYIIQTGFYNLPTLERLGEPLVLGRLGTGDWRLEIRD
ncbi:MAG TPA: hypothetical protein VF177_18275 [Anaerolineae bacterium]